VAEQAALSFGGLLRRLRTEARLTQEELAEAAQLSPRSVSDLERGINRTARKDTAEMLAEALGLDGLVRASFVAAARGRSPAEDVLAAREGSTPRVARWMRGCPYRGLLPFSESDAEVFYGRERLAAELAAKLADKASNGGLVVVTGASGSGKSSLLRAGLLPILALGQQVPGSGWWPRIVMTPTKDPLIELAARLAAVGGPDALAVRDGLARHPDQAHLAVRSAVLAAARHDGEPPGSGDGAARLVLIVDQFEQVFTLNPDLGGQATRQAFITALCSAAVNPVGPGLEPPALVVIAVRGDFWNRCAAVPELANALQSGQFVVGPMTESELRVAITGPAEAAGLRIDPALTDIILGDLRAAGADGSAGVLPLLSQAMVLTWEQREGARLTSHGYAQAGGVSHAVQTSAERVYECLSAGQQALARDVLRSMTVASRDGGLARRPVTREDLYAGLPGAARPDIDAVLDAFAAERLAVLDDDKAQLSHDVLLQAWPRLRGWLEEDQASWIMYSQLADAAVAWHDSDDDPSFLYRGAQLAALQQAVFRWSANPARSPVLTGNQRDFLQASERAAVRSNRLRRGAFAVLALLTVLAVAASGLAFSQRATAIRQRDQAIYNQLIAEALQFGVSDTTFAAQLTLAAYRIRPTQDLASRLLNTENTPLSSPLAAGAGGVNSVAFSAAGHTLASGNSGGTVRLWDVADTAHPRSLGSIRTGTAAVDWVAFSPDGHTLASGSLNGAIRLWDTTNPAHPHPLGQPLTGGTGAVETVAFSPDGHTLASSDDDGTIRLWDITDSARRRPLGQPLTGSTGTVYSVAFSPDGRTLASGSVDGAVRLWDTTDPAHPHPLGQPLTGSTAAVVVSVAFSPDGHTLASGSVDGAVRLWDTTDPAHPRPLGQPLTGSTAAVVSVAFSPDGRTLGSGNLNGAVRLWDTTDPAHPRPLGQPLTGSTAAVVSVAFSPDGRTLGSGNLNGAVRLWDTTDPAHPHPLGQPLTGAAAAVVSVAFSPDGRTLGSGSLDGTIRLWNLPQTVLAGAAAAAVSVAFSPSGHTLASSGAVGAVRLWDVTDSAHPRPLGQPLTGSTAAIQSLAFSPDGHTLASSSLDGRIWLWDTTDPGLPRPLGSTPPGRVGVVSAAFSRDGRTLAGGDYAGTVRLWDTTDPAHPRPLGQPLTGSTAAVEKVAFSPAGRTLASGGADGTVRLWDVTNPARPRPLGQPLTGSTAAVGSVAFGPDEHTLASGSLDGATRLWNLNVQYAIGRICATAGGLTPQQWNQYIPQLQYQSSCVH
jgi:WD40 repeat protein/transcriptional regulator with XRE-family HTH domain